MGYQSDEIEIDLIDMCKYFISKWMFILLGILIFGGIGFGYAKIQSVTEYISESKVYVTVPKTSDKVLIRDNANELVADYMKLMDTDLIIEKIADQSEIKKSKVKKALTAEQVEGARMLLFTVKTESEKDTKAITKEVLPVFQDVVTNTLKKNPVIVVEKPSKPEAQQSISIKKTTLIGAAGGFVIMIAALFILYLVKINREAK